MAWTGANSGSVITAGERSSGTRSLDVASRRLWLDAPSAGRSGDIAHVFAASFWSIAAPSFSHVSSILYSSMGFIQLRTAYFPFARTGSLESDPDKIGVRG